MEESKLTTEGETCPSRENTETETTTPHGPPRFNLEWNDFLWDDKNGRSQKYDKSKQTNTKNELCAGAPSLPSGTECDWSFLRKAEDELENNPGPSPNLKVNRLSSQHSNESSLVVPSIPVDISETIGNETSKDLLHPTNNSAPNLNSNGNIVDMESSQTFTNQSNCHKLEPVACEEQSSVRAQAPENNDGQCKNSDTKTTAVDTSEADMYLGKGARPKTRNTERITESSPSIGTSTHVNLSFSEGDERIPSTNYPVQGPPHSMEQTYSITRHTKGARSTPIAVQVHPDVNCLTNGLPNAIYTMDESHEKLALIFDSRNYDDPLLEHRIDSDIDFDKIENLWGDFGFSVSSYIDKSKQDIIDILSEIASRDHSKTSCFICCFLSHGHMGKITCKDSLSSDPKILDVYEDIIQLFTVKKNKTFEGKPRMFFFQCCRKIPGAAIESDGGQGQNQATNSEPRASGENNEQRCGLRDDSSPLQIDSSVDITERAFSLDGWQMIDVSTMETNQPLTAVYDSDIDHEFILNSHGFVCRERDILTSWATMPGDPAIRYAGIGSHFIDILDKYLRANETLGRTERRHFTEIMESVSTDVRAITAAYADPELPKGQLPGLHHYLQKRLYLSLKKKE